MKIGLICPYSLTIPGGVQQQVLQLARTIRELGEEVLVVAPCDGPPPEPWVVSVGPSIPAAANGSVAPIAPDPQAQLRTISILGGERFDLLHLHEPFVPGPTLTSLLAKPAPIVGTFHAAGGSAAYRYLRPVLRLLDRRLDLRCAVSEEAKRMAGEVCDGEILVLFNGIDPEPFETAEPHPKEGPTVLFLGRHEPRKGLEVLLEACEQLPSQVHVWVAGEGPETERLRARYGGDARVEWLGVVSDRERAARLKAADVFCAPSLGSESFGVVLLEAMAAGTAVVATSISGVPAGGDRGSRCPARPTRGSTGAGVCDRRAAGGRRAEEKPRGSGKAHGAPVRDGRPGEALRRYLPRARLVGRRIAASQLDGGSVIFRR